MLRVDDLVGGWELVEWTARVDGLEAGWPMGADAAGRLLYTADGSVSAVLMRRGRPTFGTTQFPGGPVDSRLAAADGYVSYAGRFELDGDAVIHHVDVALFPDFLGTDLVRLARLDGNELVLEALPDVDSRGRAIENVLRWRRS